MRIRRVLFFLAPILLTDMTSLHAGFGAAPGCIPLAALQATAGTVDSYCLSPNSVRRFLAMTPRSVTI